MILIDAVYINESGGKILLEILIQELLKQSKEPIFFLLDSRCKNNLEVSNLLPENTTLYLNASFVNRLKFYSNNKEKFTKVFCFANVPPPIRLNATVLTYFHSFMLDIPKGTSKKTKIVLNIKRWIIKSIRKNTDYWYVQSSSMERLVSEKLHAKKETIFQFPFYKPLYQNTNTERIQGSFIYMSNGYEHKNHNRLLDAWEILYAKGYNIPLTLTIKERFEILNQRIQKLQLEGYRIYNFGWIDNVEEELSKNQFQIYPSLTESFGLGLVEAVDCGCEVIASNMNYVDAVIDPIAYIDPYSVDDIVSTVLKFKDIPLDNPQQSKIKIRNDLSNLVTEILK